MKQKETHNYGVSVLNQRFIVYPEIAYSPKYFKGTEFIAQNIPVNSGESFLEIGCGVGIIISLIALAGSSIVTGIDICDYCVTCSKENANRHGLNGMEVLQGNLFDPLSLNKKFNKILFAQPLVWTPEMKLTRREKALFDPGYKVLERFLKDARSYLKKGGSIFIVNSSKLAHTEKLFGLIGKYEYQYQSIASQNFLEEASGRYITYELLELV